MNLEALKYPVGRQEVEPHPDRATSKIWIDTIANFPNVVNTLVDSLSNRELDYKYRPRGWNIRQVVHHCADSHMNAFIRFKLALTEENPTIRPYFEDRWAELSDAQLPLAASMNILEGLHQRWIQLIKGLTAEELQRKYTHPEHGQEFTLLQTLGMYDWHCRHHTAHIEQALESKGSYN